MITDQDIQKLKKVFATKEDSQDVKVDMFGIKTEMKELKQELSAVKEITQGLATGVDKIIKKLDEQEYPALKASDAEQNRRIKELADHTGYTFK